MTSTPPRSASRSGSGETPVVYLHVGAPKTGTTFLQEQLHAHRRELAEEGCLYAPSRGSAHHDEAKDLRRAGPGGYIHPKVPGSWDRLVRRVREWDGTGPVVVSSELLAFATRAQAERAIASLQPAEVHLVITLRDLVRQIPALWQETVKNRNTTPYDQFVRRILEREDDRGPRRIWDGQEPARVLARWGAQVPPERVHLVTVPPRGADPGLLWQRFLGVVGVDSAGYPLAKSRSNTSLGVAETEVVRRLNEQLQDVPWPFYSRYVKVGIAQGVLAGSSEGARLVLPESMLPWVERRTKQIIESVAGRAYDVVGDLDELLPPADGSGTGEIAEPDPRLLAQASSVAANFLVSEFSGSWQRWHHRRAEPAPTPTGRARLRQTLVDLSERHRGVGLLRRGYRVARRRLRG